MGRLTTEQVEASASSLSARCQAAMQDIRDNAGTMDIVFGPSTATKHSLDMLGDIVGTQIPAWRRIGMDIAMTEDDSRVDEWQKIGLNISANVDGFDHLGVDFTLSHIAVSAVEKTLQQGKDALPAVGLGLAALVVVAGLIAVAVIMVEVKR